MWIAFCLKVNVILAAKFFGLEEGREIDEIKFFNTKNDTILESTDIGGWFEDKVREKMLFKIASTKEIKVEIFYKP